MARPSLLFAAADLCALWCSLLLAYTIRFYSGWIPIKEHQDLSIYFLPLLLMSPVYFFLLKAMGNYQQRHGKFNHYEVLTLIRSLAFFYLVCFAATFLFHNQNHSRITIVSTFFLNVVMLLLFRKILIGIQLRRWKNGKDVVRLQLLGNHTEMMEELKNFIEQHPEIGYRIQQSKRVGQTALDFTGTNRVILVGDFTFSQIADIVLETPQHIRLDFLPAYHVFLRALPTREQIGIFPLIPLNQQLFSDWNAVTKRVLDISISAVLLLLVAPVFLLIAAGIRLSYGRPILFRQNRVGQNGRLFLLYKFRTMKPGSEKEVSPVIESNKQTIFKWRDDPRVENAFARFLRKTGLDELPQLWNVLEGTMSLVGPRPATTELVKNYSAEHKLRLAIQPGITGLQQVTCRGTISMDEILKYDIRYIQEQSLWMDLFILAKTIPTVLLGKGIS